jgi:hypothetical protein
MNSDKLNLISKDVSCATSDWIMTHPTGSKFLSLEEVFKPLLDGLVESCDWVVTGVKTGDSKFFIPKVNPENEFAELLSSIIQSLSKIDKIFSTIDLCLDLQYYKKALRIVSCKSQIINDCNEFWYVEVEELVAEIVENITIYKNEISKFRRESENDLNLAFSIKHLEHLSNSLKTNLQTYPTPAIKSNDFPKVKYTHIQSLEFKLYILLVTLINEKWSEIIVLPTIAPAGHLHHPGGIVICLSKQNSISNFMLQEIRKIASVPFLPWMLTARTTERGKTQHLMPKISDFKTAIVNDFRHIEYLMGGKKYTLTNKSLFKLKQNTNEHELPSIIGIKNLLKILNTSESNLVSNENGKLTLIEKDELVIRVNAISSELKKKKTETIYKGWLLELSHKNKNIEALILENVQNVISIVVPIASSDERFKNFKYALQSYNSQTAIKKYPRSFELIILIDSNDKNEDYRKAKSVEIVSYIKSDLIYLKEIKSIKVFYSKEEKSIGRSSIRNYGIANSTGTVIQLFDDSIVLHKNYLEEILIRFEHLRGQKFAIVGFKERLDANELFLEAILDTMNKKELLIPDAREDFKRKETLDEEINYLFKNFKANDKIDYMNLTGDLCFMNGNQKIGNRKLNQFFSTSNVAFWKNDIVDSGGFDPRFDSGWGMEDGFMGLLLVTNGTKIVPCYTALAFDLKHEKDDSKKAFKNFGEDIDNLGVFNSLNEKTISNYNRDYFEKNTKRKEEAFELLELNKEING